MIQKDTATKIVKILQQKILEFNIVELVELVTLIIESASSILSTGGILKVC